MSDLEIIAVILNLLGVWLTARRKRGIPARIDGRVHPNCFTMKFSIGQLRTAQKKPRPLLAGPWVITSYPERA
ncbi:hypothetical protein Q1W70_26380 [Pseudomonas kielensis]|jgi:hypothetical protein|uniref:hypothetical protein n=1 Tax=Pseudomonas kielensis TaxID=2762577 RepID=UPI001E36CB2A|nr:hypothetical protein [Pseudomonas kielensis]UZM15004.1 hypothetical protein LZV00_04255 [Pseudomonas kielensis]WKL52898.1 hypothetical protein Q1W70_26380 [Pseudomonas kielensis]